jgi:hypothetical protein
VLLSTAYFPPLAWFALAAKDMTLSPDRVLPSLVLLEACENYQKQSYRNRCYILAGNGVQMLQVPVVHSASSAIRDIRVDYSTPWVLRTERALDAAYQTSAYYDYYRDELFALLEARLALLWELNLGTIRFLLNNTRIACELQPTREFSLPNTTLEDYRFVIHPKKPDAVLDSLGLARPYYQVFRDRMGGFTPGLSCLDLLFNEGPNSILWLKAL